MNKTGTNTGQTDILSWSAAGSNAVSSSAATFGGLASTMSAGSLDLTKADGTISTVSWSTGSTVAQVITAVNALGTTDSGITASYNATTQKIDMIKTDATTGTSDVLSYTSRGSDAAVSTVATWATGATAFGTTVTGNLTLNLTSGTTAVIALSSVMTSDQLVAAVNALGTANTGITASYNATTGAIDFAKTDDRKGTEDVLQLSVSSGSFLSNAAVLSATGVGVDSFSLSTSVAGIDVFAHSFSAIGSEVFAASSTIAGASVDTNNFATEDGALYINGVKIDYTAGDSTSAFIAKINAKTELTGAVASLNTTTGRIEVDSTGYGSKTVLNITSGELLLGEGSSALNTYGLDAQAEITKTINGAVSNVSDQEWNRGDGLTLKDSLGNAIVLNAAGGTVTGDATSEFTVEVNSLTFQVGAYADQTREVNISAVFAYGLGNGAVADKNVSNLDLTTGQGAQDAIKVLDKAISDISGIRASLGATQTNVLESSINSLSIAKENLTASESSIRDTDMAAEMILFTKYQILQQADISMEAQANSGSKQMLSLLQ
jgi:flagellin